VGDRVAIPWLGFACGHCRYCNSGRETLCEAQINTGYGIVGTHRDIEDVFMLHALGRTRVLQKRAPSRRSTRPSTTSCTRATRSGA
jgi:Zn-dependent alcohol dehydrogenase